LLIAAFLLLLCILFEQFFIAPFFPMVDAAGSIRPMIVFLDIPLALPAIDWLPVSVLFCIFYAVVIGPSLSHTDQKGLLGRRVWKALTGWYLLLACIAAGGGLYYLVEDLLPKQVANGIDSFGVRADLTLPYPSGEFIHLHGSVLQLLFAFLGLHLMARRTAMPQPAPGLAETRAVVQAQAIINTPPPPKMPSKMSPKTPTTIPAKTPTTTILKVPRREPVLADEPTAPAPPPSRRPAVAQGSPAAAQNRSAIAQDRPATAQDRTVQDRPIPAQPGPAFPGEPPTCRLTTPPPIAIVMPRAAPGIGKVHPCFVIGSMQPKHYFSS
jgi:hypothetical protein